MKTFVTGNSRGIGLAVTEKLSSEGFEIVGGCRSDGFDIEKNFSHVVDSIGDCDIFINNAYEFTEKHSVSRQCFYPAPAVDSMLIRMDLREDAFLFSQQVRNLIRKIFTQRRKQIGSLAKKEEPSIGRIIFAWLDSIEQPYNSRPEQISVEQWKKLGELLPGDY